MYRTERSLSQLVVGFVLVQYSAVVRTLMFRAVLVVAIVDRREIDIHW